MGELSCELAECARLLDVILRGMPDLAVFQLDSDGRLTAPRSCPGGMTAMGATDLLGEHARCFFPSEDHASGLLESALAQARTQGMTHLQGWQVAPGGTRFWARVLINSITDADGHVVGFDYIVQDLTSHRDAAERAKQSAYNLDLALLHMSQCPSGIILSV